ncbi:hypothetical protein G6F57_020165 [Rhizopus arrhizus]|nr:hypothetical protein G6F57_020165 [Rhizopus arrhizus]
MMRPLEAYMADDAVREIAIPRSGELFWKKQGRWHFHTEPKLTLEYLKALISAIASYNAVNFGPILSLRMPDGERVQVGQPPAVIDGTLSLNIRKHSSVVKTLDELDAEGAFASWKNLSGPISETAVLTDEDRELLELLNTGSMKDFLHLAVQYCRNIIIGGKTGSGKTTFARSLIERVPTEERLLTIEDVHELPGAHFGHGLRSGHHADVT